MVSSSILLLLFAALCRGGQAARPAGQDDKEPESWQHHFIDNKSKLDISCVPPFIGLDGMRNHQAALAVANPVAFSIPKHVYDRAVADPGALTSHERQLILDRGDVYGRVLAEPPGTITQEERYALLGWPEPAVVERLISAATEGALHTPAELYAKAADEGVASLPEEQLLLLTTEFHGEEREERPGKRGMFGMLGMRSALIDNLPCVPGNGQARSVLMKAEGVSLRGMAEAYHESAMRLLEKWKAQRGITEKPRALDTPARQRQGQKPLGEITTEHTEESRDTSRTRKQKRV